MTDLVHIQVDYVFHSSSVSGLAQFCFMANSGWELANFLAGPVSRVYFYIFSCIIYYTVSFQKNASATVVTKYQARVWNKLSVLKPISATKFKIQKVIVKYYLTATLPYFLRFVRETIMKSNSE